MVLRILIERRRTLSLLREEQLLAEGRVDDARIKYPELAKKREELDGESVLDVLIDADPSGNQKYLMGASRILHNDMMKAEETHDHKPFWGKQWPEDASDDIYSPWGIAKNIAGFLPQYHQLMPYIRDQDAPFKDISNIKHYSALSAVVSTAEQKKLSREREKEEKKRASKQAKEESALVADTPYHIMIRPLTAHASCYFGQTTEWCISATRAANYFDQYTSEGKSFYFLLAKNKDVGSAYKKLAMVFDREGDFDEVYDTEDNSLTNQQFLGALSEAMLGATVWNQIVSFEERDPYNKDIIMNGLKNFKDEHFDFDDNDDLADIVGLFRDGPLNEYLNKLEQLGAEYTRENPAGTPEEAYDEALAEYSFNLQRRMDVQLMFPSDTGSETVYWESNTYVDVEELIENNTLGYVWRIPLEDVDDSDLHSAVDDALNAVNVYSEHIEQDYSNPAEFHIKVADGYGSLDDFNSFLNDVEHDDDNMTEGFDEALIEQLEEAEIIGSPEKMEQEAEEARRLTRDYEYWPDPEEKKKQLELPLQEHKLRLRIIKRCK